MSGVRTETVEAGDEGQRLDRWLKRQFPRLPQSRIERICRRGEVRVDGARAKPRTILSEGQRVRIPPIAAGDAPAPRKAAAGPADAELLRSSVIYRDEDLIALNKPPGMATQGGTGQTRHVDLASAALCGPGEAKPRLVHRLDKDTSGVLLLARSAKAARLLGAMFKARTTRKLYWALVSGVPASRSGVIRLPLSRRRSGAGPKMGPAAGSGPDAAADAKPAETRYAVLAELGKQAALLALKPVTGRTHQIRAHMAHAGHPVIGDGTYGPRLADEESPGPVDLVRSGRGLHLHARSLGFRHPRSGKPVNLVAPLPCHMRELFSAMEWSEDQFDSESAAHPLLAADGES